MRFHCQLLWIWLGWRGVESRSWQMVTPSSNRTASRGDAVSPWYRCPSTVSPDPAGRGRPRRPTPESGKKPNTNLENEYFVGRVFQVINIPSERGSLTISVRWNWNVCILSETNKRLWPSVIVFQVIHFPLIVITVCHGARWPRDCYVDSVQLYHSGTYHSRCYNDFASPSLLLRFFYMYSRFTFCYNVNLIFSHFVLTYRTNTFLVC